MLSIKSEIKKGAKWTSLSTIIITLIQIVQFWLLGNTLTIHEFGLVGMLTTIIIFSQIILDLGLGSAIIQKEQASHRQLSTLFWLNLLLGVLLFIVLQLGSRIFASFFHEDALIPAVRLLSFMFLIAPIGQQAQYLMQKKLSFQLIGKLETISAISSFLLLLLLLFTHIVAPIMAFVLSQVVLYSLKGILYYCFYRKIWKPSFVFDIKCCKEFFSFGLYQLLSRMVNRIGSNMDVLLIGKFMGMEALGIYNLVYQIVTVPVLKINPIVTRVAFPVFSKVQHEKKLLVDGFLYMTKLLALLSFPLLIGLFAVADLFIATFFGKEWMDAVPILKIMLIVGIFRVLSNPNGSVILAKGKANIAFYWDTAVMFLYGFALFTAVLTNQLEVVAWTYAVVSFVNFLMGRWLLAYLIHLRWGEYVNAVAVPFLLAIVIACIAYLVKWITSFYHNGTIFVLSLSVAASALVYILLLKKYLLKEVVQKVR
ncbi:MAG: MOP flippase family protein [Bacillus sp. (in: firmicutes)]